MRSTAVLLCVALVCPAPTSAQGTDPYAAGVAQAARKQLQERYDAFLDGVRAYSYAIACGALPLKNLAYGAIGRGQFVFINKLEPYEAMQKTVNQILADGPKLASSMGCEFWKENPDAVLEIRQAALAQRMP